MKSKILKLMLTLFMVLPCAFMFVACNANVNLKVRVSEDKKYVQFSTDGENWQDALTVDEIKDALGEVYKGETGEKGEVGPQGAQGEQGNPGSDGREIELRQTVNGTEWRYTTGNDTEWKVLGSYTMDDLVLVQDIADGNVDANHWYITRFDVNKDGAIDERDLAIIYVYAVRGEVIPANTNFTYGDINGDGSLNILDVTEITNYLSSGHCNNLKKLALMDLDCNFVVNENDRTLLQSYLGGSAPTPVQATVKYTFADVIMIDQLVVRESVAVTDALLARYDLDGSDSLDMKDYMLVHAYYTHGVEIDSATKHLFGDADRNGSLTVSDVSAITNYVSGGGTVSALDLALMDIDLDGEITNADSNALTSYLSNPTQYLQNIKDALIS